MQHVERQRQQTGHASILSQPPMLTETGRNSEHVTRNNMLPNEFTTWRPERGHAPRLPQGQAPPALPEKPWPYHESACACLNFHCYVFAAHCLSHSTSSSHEAAAWSDLMRHADTHFRSPYDIYSDSTRSSPRQLWEPPVLCLPSMPAAGVSPRVTRPPITFFD